MPVGVVQFDQETNEVEWFNPYAELILLVKKESLRMTSFVELLGLGEKGMPLRHLS